MVITAEVFSGSGNGDPSLTAFYQICRDDGVCLIPAEEQLFLEPPASGSAAHSSGLSSGSLLFYLLLAFLGGLLLNVMPCVLPVLSIKALNLVRQSNENKQQIRRHSLVFAAGVIGSLLLLGVIVVLLKGAGEAVGWGFQFQNPYYLFSLILILIVFSLSLFDLWTLNVTAGSGVTRVVSRRDYLGSLAGGVFTVLLATPCTAPFLGTALGFAFSQSTPVILLIFLAIGTGLALPFTLIGFIPALIRRLPKPGPWMNIFKEAMALLLLATAAWLFGVLTKQLGQQSVTPLLLTLTGALALVWIWGRFGQRSGKKALRNITALFVLSGLVVMVISLPVPAQGETGTQMETSHPGWETFSGDAVETARAEGKPVFIQFTADWCLTCKTNEAAVFSRNEIDELFTSLNVVRFYGDYTSGNAEIQQWIEMFGKAGVPVYALYPPGSSSPVLLPEILTVSILKETLNNYLAW